MFFWNVDYRVVGVFRWHYGNRNFKNRIDLLFVGFAKNQMFALNRVTALGIYDNETKMIIIYIFRLCILFIYEYIWCEFEITDVLPENFVMCVWVRDFDSLR